MKSLIEQAKQDGNDVSDNIKAKDVIDNKHKLSDNMNILDHLEKIVEISKKFGIDKCLTKGE
jgi:hypothetical protein